MENVSANAEKRDRFREYEKKALILSVHFHLGILLK